MFRSITDLSIFGNMEPGIGEHRLLPKGTRVFSTALQENVVFDNDVIVTVTNRINGPGSFVFANMQMLLFNFPGHIPTLVEKAHGTLSLKFEDTLPYKVPEPMLSMQYGERKPPITNDVTIDLDAVRAAEDNSITDSETIRQLALHSINTGDTSLLVKIRKEFQFAGLYPHVMKAFDIKPENPEGNVSRA
jgi:hypothetical protein